MFAVIFEVEPKPAQFDAYLSLAKVLRPELEAIDGFIDNERFASQAAAGRILSLSTWRDEKSLIRWRTLAIHHRAQQQGRFEIFHHYHLRVGELTADTSLPSGPTMPADRRDETETAAAKAATITTLPRGASTPDVGPAALGHELFESITDPGKRLLLADWSTEPFARRWIDDVPPTPQITHRCVHIIRNYGMHDRREAPQFHAPVVGG